MRPVLPLAVALTAVLAAAAPGQAPAVPAKVFLPAGIARPSLEGYHVFMVRPDGKTEVTDADAGGPRKFDGLCEALRSSRKYGREPTAYLFLPGRHTHGADAMKRLARNQRGGTAARPTYIGPADPEKPLPILAPFSFAMYGSHHVLVQGLVFTSGVKLSSAPQVSAEEGAPITIEGCYIHAGVLIQGGDRGVAGQHTLRRCRIVGSRGQGAFIAHAKDITLEECVIDWAGASSTRDHCIYMSRSKKVRLLRCLLSRGASSACKVMDCDDVLVKDCLILRCHNWISCNGNPNPRKPFQQCRNVLCEGNVITSMGRAKGWPAGSGGGMGYFGWNARNVVIRNNLFIHSVLPTSAILFVPPFYNGQFAGKCQDVLIEGNVVCGYPTKFIAARDSGQLKLSKFLTNVTVRGNIVGEPEGPRAVKEGEPKTWWTIPWSGVDGARALFTFGKGNVWPYWAPRHPDAAVFSQGSPRFAKVTFRDAKRTIYTLAEKLGAPPTEEGWWALVNTADPGKLMAAALAHFREGYRIVDIKDLPPPKGELFDDEPSATSQPATPAAGDPGRGPA